MLPESVQCEDCRKTAKVRGYGRLEYRLNHDDHSSTVVELETIRLTIDCPICGVKAQDYAPACGLIQERRKHAERPRRRRPK